MAGQLRDMDDEVTLPPSLPIPPFNLGRVRKSIFDSNHLPSSDPPLKQQVTGATLVQIPTHTAKVRPDNEIGG